MLKVEKRLIEETWLVALISCWLCEFALPNGGPNLIRLGVFKSASAMARGKRCCLAVLVLANIYRGLNEIVSSKTPSKCDATFPAHYLNAWLAEYFDTHFELEGSTPRLFLACLETPEKVQLSIMTRLQLVSYFMQLLASSFIVWAFLKAIERFWWMMTSYLALMQITSLANAPATWPFVAEVYV